MISYAPVVDLKPTKPEGCGGGCSDPCRCENRCCDLECLARPRFFCGQLLTDTDLTATVEWARSRFALTRYRDGWGVVCGLDVTCTHEHAAYDCGNVSHKRSMVYVHPGYAIDCCGNDLVVCEPLPVDLSEACRPVEDPCDQPPATGTSTMYDKGRRDNQRRPARNSTQTQDCWAAIGDGLLAVNLTLRYHEDLTQGQRTMFRSGCSDVGPCEYARVLERPCVHAEQVPIGQCWGDVEAEAWDTEFVDRRSRVLKELYTSGSEDLDAVLRYLKRHPPHQFCFVEDYICCLLGQAQGARGDWKSKVIVWLYLDWLLHLLRCGCGSCRPDRGVPIARVLLKRIEVASGYQCRVMLVDTGAPHRRPIRREDCRPLVIGALDLAPYMWQPVDHAQRRLEQLGVKIETKALEGDPKQVFGQALLALRSDEKRALTVWSVDDLMNCPRVAAFGRPEDL